MTLLVGLDIGTTSVKAGAVRRRRAPARRPRAQEYRIDHPAPDRAEIDAGDVLGGDAWPPSGGVLGAPPAPTRRASRRSPSPARARPSIAGRRGRPPARPGDRLARQPGPGRGPGARPSASATRPSTTGPGCRRSIRPGPPAKILWWRAPRARRCSRAAARFLLVEDFILHRLTGRFVTEGGVAVHLAALRHPRRRAGGTPMLDAVGIGPDAAARARRTRRGRGHADAPRPRRAGPARAGARSWRAGWTRAPARSGVGNVGRGHRLREHRRGADPPGVGRPPRRRPDAARRPSTSTRRRTGTSTARSAPPAAWR